MLVDLVVAAITVLLGSTAAHGTTSAYAGRVSLLPASFACTTLLAVESDRWKKIKTNPTVKFIIHICYKSYALTCFLCTTRLATNACKGAIVKVSQQSNLDKIKLQFSAFFLLSKFRKRQIALYSPCWSVGRSVSRLASQLFFLIYTGIKAFYQPSTT